MDVRLSPEQQALPDSAARLVDQLAPTPWPTSATPSAPPSSMPPWPRPAGESSERAAEGDAPLASGVEVGIVAEELGRGLADVSFLGPILAGELRRLTGAPPVARSRDRGPRRPTWPRW